MEGKRALPEGASIVIPRLVCRDPAAAIDFYVRTFEAVERLRRPGPDGTVAHAMLTIGPAMLMIEGEWPTLPSRAPKPDGSSPVVIFVYVEDVDSTVERATANGAEVLVPADDRGGARQSVVRHSCRPAEVLTAARSARAALVAAARPDFLLKLWGLEI